jgi:hypothetical protein
MSSLQFYGKAANLDSSAWTHPFSRAELFQHPRLAYNTLKNPQKHHKELRASHLEALVEAIVLHHSPELQYDSVVHIKEECTIKQIKEMIRHEQKRRIYRKIGRLLHPQRNIGLSKIGTPDTSVPHS